MKPVRILQLLTLILLFSILTLLTQIGGIVYVFSILTHKLTDKLTNKILSKLCFRFASFFLIYCFATFIIVPRVAKYFGRVPLPMIQTNNIQPLNSLTFFLNRNYVKPELMQAAFSVAKQMNKKFPGTTLNYLDANFPFWDKFPLFPHLSHSDGKKLDFSFCYRDARTKEETNRCPSFIGYGICEEPLPNESNTTEYCKDNWQYSLMSKIMPQGNKKNYLLDRDKTKELVQLFADESNIRTIFIEPHLKVRLKLRSDKIRFHGCQAVRHDDHFHIQI